MVGNSVAALSNSEEAVRTVSVLRFSNLNRTFETLVRRGETYTFTIEMIL